MAEGDCLPIPAPASCFLPPQPLPQAWGVYLPCAQHPIPVFPPVPVPIPIPISISIHTPFSSLYLFPSFPVLTLIPMAILVPISNAVPIPIPISILIPILVLIPVSVPIPPIPSLSPLLPGPAAWQCQRPLAALGCLGSARASFVL